MQNHSASTARHRIALFISMGVSLVIVIYLFAKLDWREVGLQMRQINLWYLPPLIAGFMLLMVMRAFRWKLLLPQPEKLSLARLFDATVIGFFASTVLPLRAGEIIRPWIVSRWLPVSFSAALASILIERLADAVCLLTLLILCLAQVGEVPVMVLAGAKALAILCAILMVIVFLSYLFPARMESWFHRLCSRFAGRFSPGFATRLNGMISEYFIGIRVIASWWHLVRVVLWTFAMWTLVGFWYQLMLWAFGLYPSLWTGIMLNVVISLVIAAPSAPGFVGTFQLGCIIALSSIFGYPKEFAMAYSVIAHVLQTSLVVIAGFYVLHARGMTLRQIRHVE